MSSRRNTPAKGISVYATSYSEEITGSNTMLIVKWPDEREVRFIVDFGIFQEKAWKKYNGNVLYDIEKLDFAIVTHVHADHTGLLPLLEKRKFNGAVYCSEATKRYMPVMLNEVSERILEEYKRDTKIEIKARESQKRIGSSGKKDYQRGDKCNSKKQNKGDSKKLELLYTKENVKCFMNKVCAMKLKEKFCPAPGVEITFYENGHVDGSVLTVVKVFDKNEKLYFCITGDIGVKNGLTGMKTSLPKQIAKKVSFVICEATYGANKKSIDIEFEKQKVRDIIKRAYDEKKRIICPWYAFERPMLGIKDLTEMGKTAEMKKYLKDMPVFFDTRLGMKFMDIMKKNISAFDMFRNVRTISTKDERDSLKMLQPPYILFTTFGQFTQGSILSYTEFLEYENTIILFGGYVPSHVQNYMALKKGTKVVIHGEKLELNAEMEVARYYSAHMDRLQLLEFLAQFENAKAILFHHGTNNAKQSMVEEVKDKGKIAQNLLYARTIRLDKYGISKVY